MRGGCREREEEEALQGRVPRQKCKLECRNPAPVHVFFRNCSCNADGTVLEIKQKWVRRYEGIDLRNKPAVSVKAIKRIALSGTQTTVKQDHWRPRNSPARIAFCCFQTKSHKQTGPSPTQQSPYKTALYYVLPEIFGPHCRVQTSGSLCKTCWV